jgi:glyceraldehyde-3-phosphate dehydrogenase (NADP+)
MKHGASIVNGRGGKVDRTFVAPTILFPVNNQMRIWHEEQFGPVLSDLNLKLINVGCSNCYF